MVQPAVDKKPTSALIASPTANWTPTLLVAVFACCVGGLISAGVVHSIDPVMKFADLPELGIAPKPELVKKHNDATIAFWSNNFAINFGIVGLCMGAAIGLTAAKRRLVSVLAGAILGSVGGATASFFLGKMVAAALIQSADQSLVQSSIFHFALWASILGFSMAAVGFVQGGWKALLVCGLGGIGLGIAVSLAHNLTTSIAFSRSNLLMLLPIALTERIVWITVCSIATGIGLSISLRPRQPNSSVDLDK